MKRLNWNAILWIMFYGQFLIRVSNVVAQEEYEEEISVQTSRPISFSGENSHVESAQTTLPDARPADLSSATGQRKYIFHLHTILKMILA